MRNTFFEMMNQWFIEFKQANPVTLSPSPLIVPSLAPLYPHNLVLMTVSRLSVDKVRKCEAKEFKGKIEDDLEKVEYWLVNTKRVFMELMFTLKDCLRYVVSLLKEETYEWWDTLSTMTSSDRINWDFFQGEFRKKYVSRLFFFLQEKGVP